MSPETFFYVAGTAIGIIATAVLPLYIKLRNALRELKAKDNATNIEISTAQIALHDKEKLSTEAEFQRILHYRDEESARLKAQYEKQEAQLRDLWEKYVAVLDREARLDERLKANLAEIQKNELRYQEEINKLREEVKELRNK